MPKRSIEASDRAERVLTPLVEAVYASDGSDGGTPFRTFPRSSDPLQPYVVALFEAPAPLASAFHACGDLLAVYVERAIDGRAKGTRVVHAEHTFLRGSGCTELFVVDEYDVDVDAASYVGTIDVDVCKLRMLKRGGTRIESQKLPDWRNVEFHSGYLLPPGTWPDELGAVSERDAWRQEAREDWAERVATGQCPFLARRDTDARIAGEPDGSACACLAVLDEPDIYRRIERVRDPDGVWHGAARWTNDTISARSCSAIGYFVPGVDVWWTDGPRPVPKQERPPMHAQRLRTMDVFAGCGGLMEGLQQSGLCEHAWAVEADAAACTAYRANFPGGAVYNETCDAFLTRAMRGDADVPRPGEVDAIVGGPPCQGFSYMNRHKTSAKYQAKNTLAATFVSFCDFYRPKLFVLENVVEFATQDDGRALQLAARALMAMNYDLAFRVLQAGNYGTPQWRRRLVLVAAPANARLPEFPAPTHTFNRSGSNISVRTGGVSVRFDVPAGCLYPLVTVRDAIGDLDTDDGTYAHEPRTAFQIRARAGASGNPTRHELPPCTPVGQVRIEHVPAGIMGADWRYIPDAEVRMRDGTTTSRLVFDPATGDASDARLETSLVPWSMAHTARKHGTWPGAYGRLHWRGFFPTILTRADPWRKQGVVLHPSRNRILTVREYARAQGFPDRFVFPGSRMAANMQIGNAVPVTLARALGRSFARAFPMRSDESQAPHNTAP